MEAIIANLNGYLHSLRRLSGNKCDFWAEATKIDSDLDNAIEGFLSNIKSGVKLIEKSKINYSAVEALLEELVLSNLLTDDENLKKSIAWDIVEYYGLASTALDAEGEFNPLVSNGAIKVSVQSDFHKSCVFYIVVISNYMVVTGLAERA